MPDTGVSVWYPQARAVLTVVFDGMGADDQDSDPVPITVVPKSVTVHRNSYVLPDSWELTFDATDLPVDPALVRNANVEIYLYAGRAVLDQSAIDRLSGPVVADADSAAFETDRRRGILGTIGSPPMVTGLVDDISMEFSSSGKWLTLTGQDMTAYLAAKQWPPKPNGIARRIPTGGRLDEWTQRILDEADPHHLLKVELDAGVDRNKLPTVRGDLLRGHKRGIPVEQNTTYWDVIHKVIERHGFIAFVRANSVVIGFPRNLPTPTEATIRKLAWGKNLETLRFTRKTGKGRTPAVVMDAYDPVRRSHILVDYPQGALKKAVKLNKPGASTSFVEKIKAAKPAAKTKTTTSAVKVEDQYVILPWHLFPDPALMLQSAKNRYELMAKGERTIVAVTHDLEDIDGADMMDLKAGDACSIAWQDFNREVIMNDELQDAEKLQHLTSRGFSDGVARVIVQHYRKLVDLDRPLRVREATYDYDVEGGLRVEVELHDFIVVDGVRDVDQKVTRDEKRARVKRADGKPLGYGGSPGRIKAPGVR